MPRYDIACDDCEACWDDVFCTIRKRDELGGIPCPECKQPCKVSWHNRTSPNVLCAGSRIKVEGLNGEFSTYREVEKAADAKGLRILESDEKQVVRESSKEASAAYAKELGFDSKQAYAEARKKNGEEMVMGAREKYIARKNKKYNGELKMSTDDKKFGSAGLRQKK